MKFSIGIRSENCWTNLIIVCTSQLLNPCVTKSSNYGYHVYQKLVIVQKAFT
jgi:hypothetical protein